MGYQNQSTAFILGGNDVRIEGHGQGTLDGNGDYWYEWISHQENTSNYPGRPHAITFNGLTNSIVRGLNFLRSQMWYVLVLPPLLLVEMSDSILTLFFFPPQDHVHHLQPSCRTRQHLCQQHRQPRVQL